VVSGYKVRITDSRGVMPDLQFYRAENDPRSQQAGLAEGHPDLVVEVSSPTSVRYDRVKKLTWYASIGAPEYWIVDPMQRTFERLLLEANVTRSQRWPTGRRGTAGDLRGARDSAGRAVTVRGTAAVVR
jgi:Uma2 family endonuclease